MLYNAESFLHRQIMWWLRIAWTQDLGIVVGQESCTVRLNCLCWIVRGGRWLGHAADSALEEEKEFSAVDFSSAPATYTRGRWTDVRTPVSPPLRKLASWKWFCIRPSGWAIWSCSSVSLYVSLVLPESRIVLSSLLCSSGQFPVR